MIRVTWAVALATALAAALVAAGPPPPLPPLPALQGSQPLPTEAAAVEAPSATARSVNEGKLLGAAHCGAGVDA